MPSRSQPQRDPAIVDIQGVRYFTHDEVEKAVGRTRQTIWRWRRDGQVPAGHRDRRGRVLFTASDVDAIRLYALSVEPISPQSDQQLRLFNNGNGGSSGETP